MLEDGIDGNAKQPQEAGGRARRVGGRGGGSEGGGGGGGRLRMGRICNTIKHVM